MPGRHRPGRLPGREAVYAQDLEREGRLDAAVAVHLGLVALRPESRLDVVRILIRKNVRLAEKDAAGRTSSIGSSRPRRPSRTRSRT